MRPRLVPVLVLLGLLAAGPAAAGDPPVSAAASLVAAERAFAADAAADGMGPAFLARLAGDGVVFRPLPVNGREWFSGRPDPGGVLAWTPERAEASGAGDLGYTLGPWEYRVPDTTAGEGATKAVSGGWYLSVWRRGAAGDWELAADIGTGGGAPPTWPEAPERVGLSAPGADEGPGGDGGGIDAVRALDAGAGPGYAARLDEDALAMRDGLRPVLGRDSVAGLAPPGSPRPAGGAVSASGDLAFTYGTLADTLEKGDAGAVPAGSYLRVWRRASGDWRIAVEAVLPAPPAPGAHH